MNKTDARKAMTWFQKLMGLTDWRIELCIQDSPPEWDGAEEDDMAMCWANLRYKRARIWLSPSQCAVEPIDPLIILFHEGMHVVAEDVGLAASESDHSEYTWTRVGMGLALAYTKGE